MTLARIESQGLVLLGCGKMGSAMLQGWLARGLSHTAVSVLDPHPSDWVQSLAGAGVAVNGDIPKQPAICIVAVKPQMMGDALPRLRALGNGKTVFLSIAAGTSIAAFEAELGENTPIVRAMPNTPAAIGKGISAIVGNAHVSPDDLDMCENLLDAVGQTVRLTDETQMDAVTAVSGSGPAYVFHLIETLALAGVAQGLPQDLAMTLAKATVEGAGAYATVADETPEQLRVNVTSPNGTTAAALEILMDEQQGFAPLLNNAVGAAAKRSRELGETT